MKTKTAFAALILGAGFTLTACATKNTAENNSLNSQTPDAPNANSISAIETADSSSITETTDSTLIAEGGNADIADYIEITVSEDKYFYENHEISYDDLIKVLDELNENTSVIINDENATLNAYGSLTKALEEFGILFEAAI